MNIMICDMLLLWLYLRGGEILLNGIEEIWNISLMWLLSCLALEQRTDIPSDSNRVINRDRSGFTGGGKKNSFFCLSSV